MICPNCKSNIPDDSKFCPDCGTPVKNEEELRREAKEIVTMYPKGYDYFIKYKSFPHFAYNLMAENCEKIIAKKQEIIQKHNEIIAEEKRVKEAKELEDKRREVKQIHDTYPKGYDCYALRGDIPYYNFYLSSADCDKVISNRFLIINTNNHLVAEEQKEEKRRFILNELARLNITDSDAINFFLNNPERIKDANWINWGRKINATDNKVNTKGVLQKLNYSDILIRIVLGCIALFFLFCILMMIEPINHVIMPILDAFDNLFPG